MVEYLDNGDVAVFDGYTFRKDKKTGYFLSAKKIRDGRRCRLHIYVWEKINGERVPEGYEVHHVDENKMHNEPENLECITADEHRKYHATHISEERLEKMRENIVKNVIPKAAEWHRTEQGRAWHSKQSSENFKRKKPKEYTCTYCGKKFFSKAIYGKSSNTFCSNKCRAAFRRKSGVDNIEFVCQKCGKVFMANKYAKRKFCDNCHGKKCVENLTGWIGL